uniref:Ig-like domain-containing protein n=1 Tax=Tetraodon nigroviridis TaxID=99883 RepID=H3BYP0_TETNG
MYWFRQLPGETMKLIVFTSVRAEPDFGEFSKEKFSATKAKAESGPLTVKGLEAADSGLYLCAVSEHNVTNTQPAYFGPGTKLTVL